MSASSHLVDPELLPGLEQFPSFELTAELLPIIRQQMTQFSQSLASAPIAGGTIEERFVRSREGHDVRILIHRPDGLPGASPAVLYAHGGGFLLGSADMVRASNLDMAIEADCLLVSVDYRLPPEVPHPGPVEDCYTALKWLHDNADELGVDRNRIAVAGESAGGGLAAALALLSRDRGEVRLVHQHLIYPMLDDRTCTTSANPFAGEFVWGPAENQLGWSSLLGYPAGSIDVPAYAAPSRADDLAGLPSTFIAVGALDLFAEEDMEYARRLMREGVPTELHIYPGAFHGFELAKDAQVTRTAHEISIAALKRGLSSAGVRSNIIEGTE